MEKQIIHLRVDDYTMSPGPRYSLQGDDSGEDFYHKILNFQFRKAWEQNCILEVNLDGPDGYASSFLDEAFGNLVYDFGLENVKGTLTIVSDEEPEWIDMLLNETFIEWEERRISTRMPKKTDDHTPWTKLTNGQFEDQVWIEKSI